MNTKKDYMKEYEKIETKEGRGNITSLVLRPYL